MQRIDQSAGSAERQGQAVARTGDLPAIALAPQTMPLAPDQALGINAARPIDVAAPVAARAFAIKASVPDDPRYGDAVECLAQAIYFEAASEPEAGQRAVAQVVLNRVRHPAFPRTVCGVVYQGSTLPTGCQFTFTCDGSLLRLPSRRGWARAMRIAGEMLAGRVEPTVGLATNYHADYVVPYWASSLAKLATIGRHIFYVAPSSTRNHFRAAYAYEREISPTRIQLAQPAAAPADAGAEEVGPATEQMSVEPAHRLAADAVRRLESPTARLEADRRAGELLARPQPLAQDRLRREVVPSDAR